MKRMKVLVSSLSRDFGGVESLFLSLCNNKKVDIQYDFLCWDRSAAKEEEFLEAGAEVYHLPRPGKQLKNYVRQFKSILKNGNYDVYHVNLTRFRFPLDIIIAKRMGVKVVLHSHSTQIYKTGNRKTDTIRKIQQVLFRGITLSQSAQNIACSKTAGRYLFKGRKCMIVYNGISLEKYLYSDDNRRQIRDELRIDSNDFVLGHIGRFSNEKNHKFLLKLFAQLCERGDNYKLLCIGGGDLFDEVLAYAKELNISDKVIFTGQRSDIPCLLSAMDVFVFPSIHEALPMTLIEAQTNGLPCIASDCVTREIDVLDSIQFESIDDTRNWVEWILAMDPQKNRTIDIDSLKKFNIEKMKSTLLKIYKKII